MAKKKKNETKMITSISIEPSRLKALKRLSKYANVSVSKAINDILPSPEAIDVMMAFQNQREMSKPQILKLFSDVHRKAAEQIMIHHPAYPLRLQVKAVSYFDKTGVDIFHLFKIFVKALQGERGYSFQTVTMEMGRKQQKFEYYIVLAPKENKKTVDGLIAKYFGEEGDETISHIKLSHQEWMESKRLKEALEEALQIVFRSQIREEVGKMFDEELQKVADKRKKAVKK